MSLATIAATDHQDAPAPKPAGRRRSPKATDLPAAKVARVGKVAKGAVKVSFYLSPEVIRRLKITAVAQGTDTSEVLEGVLAEAPALRQWVLSNRAKASDQATVEISTD